MYASGCGSVCDQLSVCMYASGCGSVWSIRCPYVCKWVWQCVCGQLGAHMCASGCGSVCVVN